MLWCSTWSSSREPVDLCKRYIHLVTLPLLCNLDYVKKEKKYYIVNIVSDGDCDSPNSFVDFVTTLFLQISPYLLIMIEILLLSEIFLKI